MINKIIDKLDGAGIVCCVALIMLPFVVMMSPDIALILYFCGFIFGGLGYLLFKM